MLAAVLLVSSEGGIAKTMAFVAGWVLALAAVAVATVTLYPKTPKVASSSPWVSWVQIAAGIALSGWLVVRSPGSAAPRSPSPSPDPVPMDRQSVDPQPMDPQPKWLARLDSMSAPPAFVLGAFLPNYVVVVAAVGNVVKAGLSQAQAAVTLLLFILVASAGVAAPLLLLVFQPKEAPATYRTWRAWLTTHGQGLVTIVLAVVAAVLITKGLVGLLA